MDDNIPDEPETGTDVEQPEAKPKPLPSIPTFDRDPDNWPPYAIVGSDLVKDGELRVSLKFPSRLAKVIEEIDSGRDQLIAIFRGRGNDHLIEDLDEMDNVERTVFERMWFRAYFQREGAALGEAFSSSDS